jgi:hypothetical protein
MPKPQEKTSALNGEHPVLKNMKILDFFLFLWVIFALLDPDPQFESGSGSSNSNKCGSGSETLVSTFTATFKAHMFIVYS